MSSSNSNTSNRSIVDGIFQEIARQLWPIVDKRMVDNEGVDWAASKNRNISGDLSAIVGVIIGDWERELPRYTQTGNAVSATMTKSVGTHLTKILRNNS